MSNNLKLKASKSMKNLQSLENDLLIESDDEDSADTINLISQNLTSIPPNIALNKARCTTTLILTRNRLKTLQNLKFFTNLTSLQLDRNQLKNINDLPNLPTLNLLWLNNNNLTDLNALLSILKKHTPNLEHLSLLLNPLCPSLTDNHKEYRLNVVRSLPNLKFLDTEPVTIEEREQSKTLCADHPINSANGGYSSSSNSNSNSDSERKHNRKSQTAQWRKDKLIRYELNGEEFRLYSYYKPLKIIGSGAFGVVCSAIDRRNGKKVAIKKNKYVFGEMSDAKNTLREIKLLSYFTHYKHCDIIQIYDCYAPKMEEIDSFAHIYIIMPYYTTNLLEIINSKQVLSHSHLQYITYQLLRGLTFIHNSDVIHRDIKPENILINGTSVDVKIIDFGTSRGVDMDNNAFSKEITEYVCTRWYRAPEVMCNGGRYDSKMDIWSVGCVLAEMILKKPLFPGNNYMDQLQQVFNIMHDGNESNEWIQNQQAKQWINNNLKNRQTPNKSLKEIISETFVVANGNEELDALCIDLLRKLLALNPRDRISAADAMKHAYFKNYFVNDETMSVNVVFRGGEHKKFDLSFEFEKMIETPFGLRHKMHSELHKIHEKRWKKIIKKKKHRKSRANLQKLKNIKSI